MPKTKTTPAPAVQEEKQYTPLEYDIHVYPSKVDGAQKASATVNIGGQFAIRGIKIMEGTKGLFVSMPSYRAGNGEYKDICFPCTKESKADFDQKVLSVYQQTMEQSQTATHQQDALDQQEQSTQPAMAGM